MKNRRILEVAVATLALAGVTVARPTEEKPGTRHLWADLDGDGFDELVVLAPGRPDVVLRNLGDGTLADATAELGLDGCVSRAVVLEDADGDGTVEVLRVTAAGGVRLHRSSTPGVYADVSVESGLAQVRGARDAHFLDYDRDGRVDLLVEAETGDARLFHGLDDLVFEPVVLALPVPEETAGAGGPVGPAGSAGGERVALQGTAPPPRRSGSYGAKGTSGASGPRRIAIPPDVSLPGVLPTVVPPPEITDVQPIGGQPFCATSLEDQGSPGSCIGASTTPTLGMLYPLSTSFFVEPGSGHVGIGTAQPAFGLHVVGDVRAEGNHLAGQNLTVNGALASIGGGSDHVVHDQGCTIAGGQGNTAGFDDGTGFGEFASVGGGTLNEARERGATVAGGSSNRALGAHDGVGGGAANLARGGGATVAGGIQNASEGPFAAVGGGQLNTAFGGTSTVAGGSGNRANAEFSFVGGGESNLAGGNFHSTVGGGNGNIAGADGTTIAGGQDNEATGGLATISGGLRNDATSFASVGGGADNAASGQFSTVAGGIQNTASGPSATVSGGSTNGATGNNAVVGGGNLNAAGGANSTVAGGALNLADGPGASAGGGEANRASGNYATVPGGFDNEAGGAYSFAAGRTAEALHAGSFVWSSSTDTFASTATDQFLVDASGGTGLGTSAPLASLHVQGSDIGASLPHSSAATGVFVEDTDAVLTLASENLGSVGSVVSLPDFSGGLFTDQWAMYRTTSSSGSDLRFSYGPNGNWFSNTTVLALASSGNVGIGTTSPGLRLDVVGNARAFSFIETSDARLKRDVRGLEGSLAKLRGLRGVSFVWDREALPEAEEARQLGFLAQEVREVLPEVVREDADGRLAVAYTKLVPVLVEAVKEQELRLDAQAAELERLRAIVEGLRAR